MGEPARHLALHSAAPPQGAARSLLPRRSVLGLHLTRMICFPTCRRADQRPGRHGCCGHSGGLKGLPCRSILHVIDVVAHAFIPCWPCMPAVVQSALTRVACLGANIIAVVHQASGEESGGKAVCSGCLGAPPPPKPHATSPPCPYFPRAAALLHFPHVRWWVGQLLCRASLWLWPDWQEAEVGPTVHLLGPSSGAHIPPPPPSQIAQTS